MVVCITYLLSGVGTIHAAENQNNQLAISSSSTPIIQLDGPVLGKNLAGKVEYYLDPDWQIDISDILENETIPFQVLDKSTADFGYTKSMVWLKMRAINNLDGERNWRLYFRENFKQIFDVYVLHQNGELETVLKLDQTSPFNARAIAFPEMVAPIEIAPHETVTIVVKFWSEGSSHLAYSFETPDSFTAIAGQRSAKNFVYYGMMLLLIAIASVALLIFGNVIFIAYIAYSGSTLLYLMHSDGVAFQHLWGNFPGFNSFASVVAGSGIIIFGANYARLFLRTKEFHPILNKLLWITIAAPLLLNASVVFVDLQNIKKLLVLMSLFAVLLFTVSGLVAMYKQGKQVRFFALAWGGAVLSSMIMNMRHWLGFDISQDFQHDSIRIVIVFDAAMMGLAIADRFIQLRKSRHLALKQSLAEAHHSLQLNTRLLDLEDQYATAIELAHSRREDLQNTVHDLRQPLHALRLSVRNLISEKSSQAGQRDNVEKTFSYLENLIAGHLRSNPDFVIHSTPNQHVQTPTKRDLNQLQLNEILASVHEMFLQDAMQKNLEFRFVETSKTPDIEPLVLMRIISNLVSNSIKYTHGGKVLLGVREIEGRIRIEIHDTGSGMSVEEFDQAQSREVRLNKNSTMADGNGFGLAIAKMLAQEHGYQLLLITKANHGTGIALEL